MVSSTPGVLVPVTARVSHQWTPVIRAPGAKEEEAPRPTLPFRGPRAGRGGGVDVQDHKPVPLLAGTYPVGGGVRLGEGTQADLHSHWRPWQSAAPTRTADPLSGHVPSS